MCPEGLGMTFCSSPLLLRVAPKLQRRSFQLTCITSLSVHLDQRLFSWLKSAPPALKAPNTLTPGPLAFASKSESNQSAETPPRLTKCWPVFVNVMRNSCPEEF